MRIRIKELRKSLKGWTQADLAEATGLSQPYIGAIESRNIDKSPSMDTLLKIAEALEVRIGDLFADARSIAIAGKVGAGAKVPLIDAYEKGDGLYHVACPPGLPIRLPVGLSIVGVEVEGDSMAPVYRNGDVLFYARPTADGVPTEALGAVCICEDGEGDVWVKQVKTGSQPGKFHLISLNPMADNKLDRQLKWAAPIRLHWPQELVERM